MRTFLVTLGLVAGFALFPAPARTIASVPGPAFAVVLAAPAIDAMQELPQISVDIHDSSSPSWNPMWIAIGVIGVLLVAVLFKVSNRGNAK